jgi:hypothetical protein
MFSKFVSISPYLIERFLQSSLFFNPLILLSQQYCRVTCRDWFQLTLKEGLTVFRDQVLLHTCCTLIFHHTHVIELSVQEFSSDLGCRTVKRIADVSKLRIYQFPQVSPSAIYHCITFCFLQNSHKLQ